MIEKRFVGEGKVHLIAGGGKVYTDIAAKFCRSNKEVTDLISGETSTTLIQTIIDSGHNAALEFDDFIFGVEGFSRVTEVQMVRKRHASYMISSGRTEGKTDVGVSIPKTIADYKTMIRLDPHINKVFGYEELLDIIDQWYQAGIRDGLPAEDLRYLLPQATTFKGIVKINACGLRDWAKIRMCLRAQSEIRLMVTEMVKLAKEANPAVMKGVGPSCVALGYCPELEQCKHFTGKIPTKQEAFELIRKNYNP